MLRPQVLLLGLISIASRSCTKLVTYPSEPGMVVQESREAIEEIMMARPRVQALERQLVPEAIRLIAEGRVRIDNGRTRIIRGNEGVSSKPA